MSITKRVTYLKGLVEGLGLGRDTKEERILHVIIEILDDMTVELADLKEEVIALDEDISQLAEGVEDLEDTFYDDDEPEVCACPAQPVAPPAPAPTSAPAPVAPPVSRPAPRPPKPSFYAVNCPSCTGEITIDDDILGLGTIDCPNCGEKLEFDLDDVG